MTAASLRDVEATLTRQPYPSVAINVQPRR